MISKRKADATITAINPREGESLTEQGRRQVAKKPRKGKTSTYDTTTWPEYFNVVCGLFTMIL